MLENVILVKPGARTGDDGSIAGLSDRPPDGNKSEKPKIVGWTNCLGHDVFGGTEVRSQRSRNEKYSASQQRTGNSPIL